jgi:hypothetical protein
MVVLYFVIRRPPEAVSFKNENIEENGCSRVCSFNTEYFLYLEYGIGDRVLDRHLGDRPAISGDLKQPAFAAGII